MKRINSFSEANDFLSRIDSDFTSYNLHNIRFLMSHLDSPQNKFKAVHVAGTSGKTSTAYFIASLLSVSGVKTGLAVSPALDQINERVQINLQPPPETDYIHAFNEFLNKLSNIAISPSRFEIMVAFAFWYFAEQKVDYAVIEVILGGLNDATNSMERPDKICLITDIGFDHESILGDSLTKIAAHKAGIIMPGNHVFMHRQATEAMDVVEWRVKRVGANMNVVKNNQKGDFPFPDYQQRNWTLARSAYEYIQSRDNLPRLEEKAINQAKLVKVPGRMDIKKYKGKTIILDGAHNPQKMSAFILSFRKLYPGIKPAVLVAIKSTKDYEKMASELDNLASRIIATEFTGNSNPISDSVPAAQLAEEFGHGVIVMPNLTKACTMLLESEEEVLVITGSLHLIGCLRRLFSFLN